MYQIFLTFRLPVGCTGSYTKDEPNFPLQNTGNLISQKTVWRDKVLNFEDFSRPSKEIQYFSRTLLFKMKTKNKDLFKLVKTKYECCQLNTG